ncbi:GNAT family N-acetyltransferase [bacterium]|nr:GNAT family N-acetyltransferase [bacterium]
MVEIVPYTPDRLDAVLALTLRAWEPVFPLMQKDIPDYVFDAFYPDGWRKRQMADVEAMFRGAEAEMWVALVEGALAGYLGLRVHPDDQMGEIHIIAVDPDHQRKGVGAALMTFAFDWMRSRGLKMAFVETGGDRGHAPARASYERMGFERYPVARYFKRL